MPELYENTLKMYCKDEIKFQLIKNLLFKPDAD